MNNTVNLLEEAERFVLGHPLLGDIERDEMVRRTTVHLTNQYAISQRTGGLTAAKAVANIEAKM